MSIRFAIGILDIEALVLKHFFPKISLTSVLTIEFMLLSYCWMAAVGT